MYEKLTEQEKIQLDNFKMNTAITEMAQVEELMTCCNNKYQYAKTYSVYVKDWKKTKNTLEKRSTPSNMSPEFWEAMIMAGDEIFQSKLNIAQQGFEIKFGESIFSGYLNADGTTKGLFNSLFK